MRNRSLLLPIFLGALAFACGDSNPSDPGVGPPSNILILAGATQQGVAGQPSAIAPAVLITDAQNRPVPGATVTFSIVSGGGSLSSTTATTNSTGVATVVWTLGSAFGQKVLQATSGSLGPVTFNATAIASDAGTLAFSQADPAGDTLGISPPGEPRAIDLLSLRGDFKRDSLILTLTFTAPVVPASNFAANSVSGFIEIDIDDNAATGDDPFSNFFGASANLGIEYAVSLFDATSSEILLLSATGATSVPVAFLGNVVTIRIPMSLLANDDGNFGVVSVIGTDEFPTDVAPNSGAISVRRTALGGSLSIAKLSRPEAVLPVRPPPRWEMPRR